MRGTNQRQRTGIKFWQGILDQHVHTAIFKMITNKDLVQSTRNFAQRYVAAWMGAELGREWIYVYVMAESLHCLPEAIITLLIGYAPQQNKIKFKFKKTLVDT